MLHVNLVKFVLFFVRMNALISVTRSARDMKFGMKDSLCHTQLKLV